jgi:poly-D-alanine transfer protein DltD
MTAADIAQQIEQLQTDRATLQARQDEITTILARDWHTPQPDLETEFATLSARLQAAEKALAQLDRDHEQALTADLLAEHATAHAEAMALKVESDKARAKRDKQALKLEQVTDEARAAYQTYQHAYNRAHTIERDLEKRGISRAQLYADQEQSA